MKIESISITKLHLFCENPFKVRKDEAFDELVESVSADGIYEPLIVCPDKDKGGYIIISGQRRFEAAKTAGLNTVPAVIHDMDRDKMIIAIVDNNICSRDILPSERAFAYRMKLDAMNRQGRRTDLTFSQNGKKLNSYEEIAAQTGDSRSTIHRYIRLTNLIPELLDLMDERKIAFSVGVELSYLDEEKQYFILNLIEELDCTPSYSQANHIHKDFIEGVLTDDSITRMMSTDKPNQRPVYKISAEKFNKYIIPGTPPKEAEEYLLKACEYYQRVINRRRNIDAR